MIAFAIYLLKVIICSGILFLYYHIPPHFTTQYIKKIFPNIKMGLFTYSKA